MENEGRHMTDYVTKADLNQAVEQIRGELSSLDGRLSSLDERMSANMNSLEERMLERMEKIETRLLSAFHDYAVVADIRFRKLEANEGNTSKAI